jgi:hypothetical protein
MSWNQGDYIPSARAVELAARAYEHDGMASTAEKIRCGYYYSAAVWRLCRALDEALEQPKLL